MEELSREAVLASLLKVLDEALEGPRDPRFTWFTNNAPDSGVHGTLAELSAGEASRASGPGRKSVAAHAEHLRFSLDVGTRWARGERLRVDWAESWGVQTVDEAEWSALREAVRAEYAAFRRAVEERAEWDPATVTGVAAAVAHTAYHLGAMRQIALEVRAPSAETAEAAGAA